MIVLKRKERREEDGDFRCCARDGVLPVLRCSGTGRQHDVQRVRRGGADRPEADTRAAEKKYGCPLGLEYFRNLFHIRPLCRVGVEHGFESERLYLVQSLAIRRRRIVPTGQDF